VIEAAGQLLEPRHRFFFSQKSAAEKAFDDLPPEPVFAGDEFQGR